MTTTVNQTVAAFFAVSVAAMVFAIATPASAFGGYHGHGMSGDETTVSNSNAAAVVNLVDVDARTGGNDANGGDGDDGGNAMSWNGDATGGRGGNGGAAGTIQTGSAVAFSGIMNDVNYNETTIESGCGCGGRGGDEITTRNRNLAFVLNGADVDAATGNNDANGGDGDDGGNASAWGSQSFSNYYSRHGHGGGSNSDATGGAGGYGAAGGSVTTGNANGRSELTNLVNTNVTRVTRGGAPS